jgi:hypothetical protein
MMTPLIGLKYVAEMVLFDIILLKMLCFDGDKIYHFLHQAAYMDKVKKEKGHPRTGHEGLEWE